MQSEQKPGSIFWDIDLKFHMDEYMCKMENINSKIKIKIHFKYGWIFSTRYQGVLYVMEIKMTEYYLINAKQIIGSYQWVQNHATASMELSEWWRKDDQLVYVAGSLSHTHQIISLFSWAHRKSTFLITPCVQEGVNGI